MLSEATRSYNCFGYAWQVSEGSEPVWINDPVDDEFWNDDSYVETSWEENVKVSFPVDADHAAVTTGHQDTLISKWGQYPLFKHHINDCDYTPKTNLIYYKLADVSTSSSSGGALCNNTQRTFTSNFNDPNFTYNWNYTSPLDEVSEDDETYIVKGTSQNGQGTVSLTITTPSGVTRSTSRKVWVGAPDLDNIEVYYSSDITGYYSDEMCPGEMNELQARTNPVSLNMGITSLYWDMSNWDVTENDGEGYVLFSIPSHFSGSEDVYYEVENNCNIGIDTETLYEGDCGGYFMMMAPNPATTETTVTLQTTNENEPIDENIEWEMEVYSPTQILKETKNNLKGKAHKIKTNGWKAGVYIVRAKYKDKIIPGKLIIQD